MEHLYCAGDTCTFLLHKIRSEENRRNASALSIFHCGRIKVGGGGPWEKKTWPVFPFCTQSKNKTHFKWETLGFSCHVGFDV